MSDLDYYFGLSSDPSPSALHGLVTSVGFWTALTGAFAGALAGFALGLLSQMLAVRRANRSAGNLAIVTLGEMYSEAKALHDSLFVAPLPNLRALLKREPLYFEYKGVVDVPREPPFEIERLGFLADSHDPDVLVRIIAARNQFSAMLLLAQTHGRLHAELQNRLAKDDPTGQKAHRPQDLPAIVGMDVLLQLKSAFEGLQTGLPESLRSLRALCEQLRDVLRFHFPWSSFLRFIPEDRGPVSTATIYARKPALWRRGARGFRGLLDRAFGPRWPGDPQK